MKRSIKILIIDDEALGRSRWGGNSTKVHTCVDALGNPGQIILTAGQRSYGSNCLRPVIHKICLPSGNSIVCNTRRIATK